MYAMYACCCSDGKQANDLELKNANGYQTVSVMCDVYMASPFLRCYR